jgi:Ala-tRNA(Pro) deacylase
MSLTRLKELLDSHNIRYTVISHSVAYTAQAIAALTHIPGKELVKTVVVKIDGDLAMAALPASYQVDLMLLKQATGARQVPRLRTWRHAPVRKPVWDEGLR